MSSSDECKTLACLKPGITRRAHTNYEALKQLWRLERCYAEDAPLRWIPWALLMTIHLEELRNPYQRDTQVQKVTPESSRAVYILKCMANTDGALWAPEEDKMIEVLHMGYVWLSRVLRARIQSCSGFLGHVIGSGFIWFGISLYTYD